MVTKKSSNVVLWDLSWVVRSVRAWCSSAKRENANLYHSLVEYHFKFSNESARMHTLEYEYTGTARVARVLDQPDVKVLLSSIRQIATLNQQFTLDLKEKTRGWPAIIYTADTFEHFAAVCSRAFGTYARSHAEAVTHLESDVFSDFMRKVKEVTGADCRSLLGKPSVYVPRVRIVRAWYSSVVFERGIFIHLLGVRSLFCVSCFQCVSSACFIIIIIT